MAEQNSYSYLDIHRYLQRQMTPQEMHAFEKAMLDDPFLADAMEGYRSTDKDVAAKHLTAIEKSIRANESPAKVVALPARNRKWYSAAAAVLIIATGGVLTYQLTKTQTSTSAPEVAAIKQKEVTVSTDSVKQPGVSNDLVTNARQLKSLVKDGKVQSSSPVIDQQANAATGTYAPEATGDTALIVMSAPSFDAEEKVTAYQRKYAGSAAKTEANQEKEMATAKADAYQDRRMAMAKAASAPPASNEFVGKVVDDSGEPMPFASVRATNTNAGTITDAQGRFMLRAPDSVLNVNVQSAGYATANVEIRSNRNQDVVLQEDKANLSEVVVTNMSKKKNIASRSKTDTSNSAPNGGWSNFNNYVNARVDSLKAVSKYAFNNEDVELEFNVDKQGHPTDIKPTKEVSKDVADKAIDILKEGPTWTKPAKKKKVRVKLNL